MTLIVKSLTIENLVAWCLLTRHAQSAHSFVILLSIQVYLMELLNCSFLWECPIYRCRCFIWPHLFMTILARHTCTAVSYPTNSYAESSLGNVSATTFFSTPSCLGTKFKVALFSRESVLRFCWLFQIKLNVMLVPSGILTIAWLSFYI